MSNVTASSSNFIPPPDDAFTQTLDGKPFKITDPFTNRTSALTKLNNYILLTIRDTGIGFSNNDKNNLIKPYYTTKKNGSGLGLSIVNKIINDHNGILKILPNSTGAIIKINLPNDVHRNINN